MTHTPLHTLLSALALAASASLMPVAAQESAPMPAPVEAPATPVPAAARALPDFTALVEQVGPAVVNIRTSERVRSSQRFKGMDEDMQEFFRRFFGTPFPGLPDDEDDESAAPGREVPRGVGSGFVISADGYIMTNAHVVEGADEVLVTLPDQREFKAEVIGADKRTDVAVLKVDATGLPVVRIGDVGQLRVGQWVLAIGSPFGLESTVTAGIVSAKQRDTGNYLPFIQTDVAVNPGNSGGPLINMRGEVVGINSQIYSRSGGFMGISFAIPIDEAMRVSEQLRATGHVSRGLIGVQVAEVTREVAESIGLGKARGALVRGVQSGSPAEKAGIEAGDIITRYSGHDISRMSDLPRLVGNTKPGTDAPVTVFRRGQTLEKTVTVTEMEADKTERRSAKRAKDQQAAPGTVQALGITVAELKDTQKRELKLQRGVVVQSASGAGARAGLREGDIILSVGNTEIHNVRDFEAAARPVAGKPVNMLVQREDLVQFVLVHPQQ